MTTAEVVKKTESQPMFGAGAQQPSQERNFQEIEWILPSGERVRLETSVFQLDGKNPYTLPGGPVMPMYRAFQFKRKRLLGWKKFAEGLEYSGGFALLNALIRTTDRYRRADEAGRADELLIRKKSYEHRRFGEHEYFAVVEEAPLAALTEAVGLCRSAKELLGRLREIERNPDEELRQDKAALRVELEQLRASVR